jgi:hypothetical protein
MITAESINEAVELGRSEEEGCKGGEGEGEEG